MSTVRTASIGVRSRRVVLAAIGAATLALGVFGGLAPTESGASSHREAPLTSADPQIDSTDLYAFVSPNDPTKVTLISNWIPFEGTDAGPNFYAFAPGVRYDVNIDNNGDAKPDIVYRWEFTNRYRNDKTFLYNTGPVRSLDDETLNFTQRYTLTEIRGSRTKTLVKNAVVVPTNVGRASMPDYPALWRSGIETFAGSGKSFVGPVDDPFFLDLRVFDLLYGTDLKSVGNDSLRRFNVHALALEVPATTLAAAGDAAKNPIVGIWTTASRRSIRVTSATGSEKSSGGFVQVSRLGMPLVNEVVVPAGVKDYFNASKPADDAQFLEAVQDPELPKLIQGVYKIDAPKAPRNDLVSVFLTGVKDLNMPANVRPSEQLRLNTSIKPASIPNRLGVLGGDNAGFPNGRRLTDDVVDIALQVVEGELVGSPNDLGDGVNANDVTFQSAFPYLALPHTGPAAVQTAGAVERVTRAGIWPLLTGIVSGVAFLALIWLIARRRRSTSGDRNRMRPAA